MMIASQLRSPLPQIPAGKIHELLEIKKRLGLPDARLPDFDQEMDPSPLENKNSKYSPLLSGRPQRVHESSREALVATLTARIFDDLSIDLARAKRIP